MSVVAQAGVVDEEVHIDVFIVEPIGQGEASFRQGEVGSKNPDIECGVKSVITAVASCRVVMGGWSLYSESLERTSRRFTVKPTHTSPVSLLSDR